MTLMRAFLEEQQEQSSIGVGLRENRAEQIAVFVWTTFLRNIVGKGSLEGSVGSREGVVSSSEKSYHDIFIC